MEVMACGVHAALCAVEQAHCDKHNVHNLKPTAFSIYSELQLIVH
jgi:hypothetical protein